jgi:hypothetical protein
LGLVATLSVLGLAAGCSGKDPYAPGTTIGTFHIEARKSAATCGDATSAPDPWAFDVHFSRDGTTLYWLQNRAPVSGHVGADRKVHLETSDTRTLQATVRKGLPPITCTVTRTDTFDAILGPDEPLGDAGTGGFSTVGGTLRYSFTADDPASCAELGDPSLSVMPCQLVYEVSGKKK